MMPFTLLPIILAAGFFLIWAFVVWIKYYEHLGAERHDREARHHVVSVRKVGPPRKRVDHSAG
jgi:hypothetical protein